MEQITEIQLDRIQPFPGNRRIGGFDQAKLEQLAESIRAVGVQQPAVVRLVVGEHPEGVYELVAGERRWRAARMAGLTTLPCVVRMLDDVEVLKIHTIENLQREEVHPLDESDGFRRLLDAAGYTAEQIGHELGKSTSYVYQRLKLQDLVPKARELLEKGTITAGHAIQIARLAEEQQAEVLKFFRDQTNSQTSDVMGVRELARRIEYSILMLLDGASFRRDDADLVPEAGACKTCQKRTGYEPALFEDVGKDDRCTDRKCFTRKLDAAVARHLAEHKADELLLVRGDYDPSEKQKTDQHVASALRTWQWQECKKKDDGAQRALIVSGLGRGRLLWAIDLGKHPASGAEDDDDVDPEYREEIEARQRELAEQKADRERRSKELVELYHAVVEASIGRELDVVGVIAEAVCFEDRYSSGEYMYEIEGWKVPEGEDEYSQLRDDLARRIREAVPSEQIRIMLRLVIANDCWPWNWYGPEQTPRTLYAACDALGIPHPEVIATQNDQVDEETDGDEEPDDEDVGA